MMTADTGEAGHGPGGDNGGPGTMIHGMIVNWFPYLLHLDMYIGNANCNIRSLIKIYIFKFAYMGKFR